MGRTAGFTLLEVMIALAIMAGVVVTVLGTVNYHLSVIAAERDSTALTLIARAKVTELEQGQIPERSEGTFAPLHPELTWQAELQPTQVPALKKLVLRVRNSDRREVALVRYVLPK